MFLFNTVWHYDVPLFLFHIRGNDIVCKEKTSVYRRFYTIVFWEFHDGVLNFRFFKIRIQSSSQCRQAIIKV